MAKARNGRSPSLDCDCGEWDDGLIEKSGVLVVGEIWEGARIVDQVPPHSALQQTRNLPNHHPCL